MSEGISWLFVPGSRPDRFDKARDCGADQIILDLEDAVDPADKEGARGVVAGWLSASGRAWVRVNAAGTPWYDQDLACLAAMSGLVGVVVPKAEDPNALLAVRHALRVDQGLIALIETALGVHRAVEIAAAATVNRLAFGSVDFALDIDAEETDEALLLGRSTLVLASRLGCKPAPIDGITARFDEPVKVAVAARRARQLGFGGKLCIHPSQIQPVSEGFRPSEHEVAFAMQVLAAADGSGAAATAGTMIDRPVLDRARRIMDRSRRL